MVLFFGPAVIVNFNILTQYRFEYLLTYTWKS